MTGISTAYKNLGLISAQNTIMLGLGTLLYIFQTRILSRAELGIFATLLTIQAIMITIGVLGLNYTLSRFIPLFKSGNDHNSLTIFSRRVFIVSSFSALSIFIVCYFSASTSSFYLFNTKKFTYLLQLQAIVIGLGIISLVLLGYLQGLQLFHHWSIYRTTAQIARVGSSILLLFLGFKVEGILFGWIVYYTILIFACSFVVIKLIIQRYNKFEVDHAEVSYQKILLFSTPLFINEIIQVTFNPIDQMLILNVLTLDLVGVYNVALNSSMLINQVIIMPLIIVLIPSFTNIYRDSEVNYINTNYLKHITLFVGPFIFGLIALAPLAIEILSGTKFLDAIPAFRIISVGMFLYIFSAFIKSILTAIGKIRIILYVQLVTLITKIIITYSLTSFFGLIGTAIGNIITYGLMFLIYKVVSEREVKIKIRIKEIFMISGISALMGGIVFVVAQITNYTIFLLPLYVLIGIFIYLLVIGFFNILTKTDFRLLMAIIPLGDKARSQILEKINKSKYLMKVTEFLFDEE